MSSGIGPYIQVITDDDQLADLINHNSKLVVLYFFTKWCGPCKIVGPIVERMSQEFYKNTLFLKVDAETCPDASEYFKIKTVPTFVIIKQDLIISNIEGADTTALRLAIDQNN